MDFSGTNCETFDGESNVCDSAPCQNEAPCTGISPTEYDCDCDAVFPFYGDECQHTPEILVSGTCLEDDSCVCSGVGIKLGVVFNDQVDPRFQFCASGGNSCFCLHYVI